MLSIIIIATIYEILYSHFHISAFHDPPIFRIFHKVPSPQISQLIDVRLNLRIISTISLVAEYSFQKFPSSKQVKIKAARSRIRAEESTCP